MQKIIFIWVLKLAYSSKIWNSGHKIKQFFLEQSRKNVFQSLENCKKIRLFQCSFKITRSKIVLKKKKIEFSSINKGCIIQVARENTHLWFLKTFYGISRIMAFENMKLLKCPLRKRFFAKRFAKESACHVNQCSVYKISKFFHISQIAKLPTQYISH